MSKYFFIIKGKIFVENKIKKTEIPVPVEKKLEIFLNNEKFVNILCTPIDIEDLIIGFLFSEKIILNFNDIKFIKIEKESLNNNFIRVYVTTTSRIKINEKDKTLTSGFGKGLMFTTEGKKVISKLKISPNFILDLMRSFQDKMNIYKLSGAVHASCIADINDVIVVKEDIGRHNTFDKIAGYCLKTNIDTKDKIIMTTGRISTEMLLKSSRMEIPIVITMKSPTSNTLKVAKDLGITVVGRVKPDKNSFIIFEDSCERIYN